MDGSHARWRENVWRTIVFELPLTEATPTKIEDRRRKKNAAFEDSRQTVSIHTTYRQTVGQVLPRARIVPRTAIRSQPKIISLFPASIQTTTHTQHPTPKSVAAQTEGERENDAAVHTHTLYKKKK
jgi:hypothetical protein